MVLIVLPYVLVGVVIASGWHWVDLHLRPARGVALKYCLTLVAWPFFLVCTIAIAVLARRIDPHRQRRSPNTSAPAGLVVTMPRNTGAREALDA